MRSGISIFLGSALAAVPIAAVAAEPMLLRVVENDRAEPLTIEGAKRLVAQALLMSGQRNVRVGHADYAGNGNFLVDIVTVDNMRLRQVLVDGRTRQIAAVKGALKG